GRISVVPIAMSLLTELITGGVDCCYKHGAPDGASSFILHPSLTASLAGATAAVLRVAAGASSVAVLPLALLPDLPQESQCACRRTAHGAAKEASFPRQRAVDS